MAVSMNWRLVDKENDHGVSIELVRRTASVASRNAIYAAIGRILIGILKRLGKGGLRMSVLRQLGREFLSLDPLKWAFVLAGLSCYRLIKQMIAGLPSFFRITEKAAALLSGCICALPALVMNRETRTDLSLYVFVRALHSFCVGRVVPLLPKPMREFEYYDILTMCLSASQILYSVVFAPFSMPPSYQQFLSKVSMLDNRLVRGHAGLARYQLVPELVELCMEKGLSIPESPKEHFKIGCHYAHSGISCNQFYFSFICKNMLQVGLPLYFPLKLVTTLLFQQKELKRRPLKVLRGAVRSVLLSSLFLALYSGSTVRFACFAAQGNIRGGIYFALTCSLAGIATLLEPKGRRMDLALYCLMYALRSFVITQYRLGRIPYPRHDFVFLLYLFSIGFLFFQYDREPEKLNSRVRSIIVNLLGEKQSSNHGLKAAEVSEGPRKG
ncbi:hypothetical protein DQ04_00191270 [Trypanosoma grayi]|uniref:hypothetical protein n=1 Tax=Trypanosoma grayi TaxID=71804 RepID=UPI0004F47F46|nr:hypothetical protein DQ04_00191270 [Trypanosoma grayi]KEG15103.1 hypothetical protein DQ04_00191270 [Trypanosoma grayi]